MKACVILSGAGYLDGSEIQESVLTLLNLDKQKIKYDCFSLDQEQKQNINHLDQKEISSTLNMKEQSARIARSEILDLELLDSKNYDFIIFPGGYGVAKNFSDFAFVGKNYKIHPKISQVLREFYKNKKPI